MLTFPFGLAFGFIAGGVVGVAVMCLMIVASKSDNDDEEG